MNFKFLTLTLFILIAAKASQCFALSFNVRFSIDDNIYKNLNATQKNTLQNKIQGIHHFIGNDLESKIPPLVKEKIQNLNIKFVFTNELERDGLFIPGDSGHTISIKYLNIYNNGINSLVAHEIYHAIHFHVNPNEEAWIREGMAQVFEYMTTGELNGMNLYSAIKDPFTPLIGTYNHENNIPAQYGHNMLYFYYLFKQCGRDALFWQLTQGNPEKRLKGTKLIDHVLSQVKDNLEQCSNFKTSALTYEVAKNHNQVIFNNTNNSKMYFVYPGNIVSAIGPITNQTELNKIIDSMPALSSFKLKITEKNSFLSPQCSQCYLFFSQKSFPYSLEKTLPQGSNLLDYDLIIVKDLVD